MKMDGSDLEGKTSSKILGLSFSSKLEWGSYIVSIAKTASKKIEKIGALIRSMVCLSPKVALYLYTFTIRPCKECCCHVWVGAPSYYFDILDELWKLICRTVGLVPSTSRKPLSHHRNAASWSLFFRYYFGKFLSELPKLISCPYSGGRSTPYTDIYHNFSVNFSRCNKNVYVNSFFCFTQLNSGIMCLQNVSL